jgi:hypothetical protein
MTQTRGKWLPVLIAASVGVTFELLAAVNSHGRELIWVPAVIVGASWPRSSRSRRLRSCVRRLAGGASSSAR